MEISINGAPVYFTLDVFGGIPISATLVVTWAIMLLLTGLCIWMTRDLKVAGISKKQAVAEFLVTTAENFVNNNMGPKWSRYIPFIAALFALSLCSSLSSLLGLFAPTADLSTELAWAIVVFIMITGTKIRSGGVGGYLKGFTKPISFSRPSISSVSWLRRSPWRSVISATSFRARSSARWCTQLWRRQTERCLGFCPAWLAICWGRSRSFRWVFPQCSVCILTGSPALCRHSFSAC